MKFYECTHCGNMVMMIEDSGVTPVCCGEDMHELEAGVSDGAKEKHVPFVSLEGTTMHVNIGEVDHPMLAEHYIQWILVDQDGDIQMQRLRAGEAPKATFLVTPGPYTVYEYCNLHGLWKKEGTVA